MWPGNTTMTKTERQNQVRKLILDLSARFGEQKVELTDTFWTGWDDLDTVCHSYIETGKPTWEKIKGRSRELYCYVMAVK